MSNKKENAFFFFNRLQRNHVESNQLQDGGDGAKKTLEKKAGVRFVGGFKSD